MICQRCSRSAQCLLAPFSDAESFEVPVDSCPNFDPYFEQMAPGIMAFMVSCLFRLSKLGRLPNLARNLGKGPVRLGTLFSGLEVFIMVAVSLALAWPQVLKAHPEFGDADCLFRHTVGAENDPKKRRVAMLVSPDVEAMYGDVLDLSKNNGGGYDYVSESWVAATPPEVLCFGFPCKNISDYNNTRKNHVFRKSKFCNKHHGF